MNGFPWVGFQIFFSEATPGRTRRLTGFKVLGQNGLDGLTH